jgi:hypothetical protein
MRALRCRTGMVWAMVLALCGAISVDAHAQQPTSARATSSTAPKASVARPPAILSAAPPHESDYQVAAPPPERLRSSQTRGAQALFPGSALEVGSGVRPAAYQLPEEVQPYYPQPGARIDRLPPPVGSQAIPSPGPIAESWPGGEMLGHEMHHSGGYAMPGCAPCNPACDPCCFPPPLIGLPRLGSIELLAGAHGFTGPLNRGSTASFGFHQGGQVGVPIAGMATAEFGALVTQSNFEGSLLTNEGRQQLFLTAGAFRRVDWGLQGGLVFDYLHDEWDYEVDLGQIRGEVSWVLPCGHDVGAWFAIGVNDSQSEVHVMEPIPGATVDVTTAFESFEVNDIFAFFYRRQFMCGGEGRLFGGFTSEGQGLFGGDARMPINPCWALEADFLYVAGRDREDAPAFYDETWNVSVGVAWTPWAGRCASKYNRPLLGVANNGNFITRMK